MNPTPSFLRSPCVWRIFFAGLIAFLFSAGGWAQAPASGTIEGRVFDPRRGEYVENARITLEGTGQQVFSDPTGYYRIPNVPVGTAKLSIFFTGRGTQAEQVAVAAGERVVRDVTLTGGARAPKGRGRSREARRLHRLVVEGDGRRRARDQRAAFRQATSCNVVSADEFGTIADGSIGEFMKFLPGITSDYTGGDARRFSINGVPADNVPISMGGFEMASAAGAGTRRASRARPGFDQQRLAHRDQPLAHAGYARARRSPAR
jgi:iron complex outermembrane receptor protein